MSESVIFSSSLKSRDEIEKDYFFVAPEFLDLYEDYLSDHKEERHGLKIKSEVEGQLPELGMEAAAALLSLGASQDFPYESVLILADGNLYRFDQMTDSEGATPKIWVSYENPEPKPNGSEIVVEAL